MLRKIRALGIDAIVIQHIWKASSSRKQDYTYGIYTAIWNQTQITAPSPEKVMEPYNDTLLI